MTIQDNTLKEIKADKQPVGKSYDTKLFTIHHIELKTATTFYLFNDGFADQFGGSKGKKFKYKQFGELLLSISNKPMIEQKEIIGKNIVNGKANLNGWTTFAKLELKSKSQCSLKQLL